MDRILVYLSAREISGSLFRFRALWRAMRSWGEDWDVVVRTPLDPPWEPCFGLLWEKIPLPEPPPHLGGDRMKEWIEEWIKGWELWGEGEKAVVEDLRPLVILSDMAPQPLLLAREMGIPGWFLGHFNWFSYLSQFMEVSGLLDDLALAYESAQVAFVPPLSWGQGIFPLTQEVPLVGGEVDGDRVRNTRKRVLAQGTPVFVDEGLDPSVLGIGETWGDVVFLFALEDLPAVQVAYLKPFYSNLVMALRGEVPCVLYPSHREPEVSMAMEMKGLGLALVMEKVRDKPSSHEVARLVNGAYEAFRALSSLYRLEGSQFIVEKINQLRF